MDRAGFEPAALRSSVSAFPHFGFDHRPAKRAIFSQQTNRLLCTRLIYRPTRNAEPGKGVKVVYFESC